MRNMEESYIRQIDSERIPTSPEVMDLGRRAEEIVIDFMGALPGMEMRRATPMEDSGLNQIVKDKAIDAVGYLDGRPAIGVQITTASNKAVRGDKASDLMNRPFIRLSEMKPSDPAIPRSLVFVESSDVMEFQADPDFDKHPKLTKQILDSNINSLMLVLMKTKNPKEQEFIKKLLSLFALAQVALKDKVKGVSH